MKYLVKSSLIIKIMNHLASMMLLTTNPMIAYVPTLISLESLLEFRHHICHGRNNLLFNNTKLPKRIFKWKLGYSSAAGLSLCLLWDPVA